MSITPTFTTTGGGSTTIALDTAGLTQYAGSFTVLNASRDGNLAGSLKSISIDEDGILSGNFSNGESRGL